MKNRYLFQWREPTVDDNYSENATIVMADNMAAAIALFCHRYDGWPAAIEPVVSITIV